MVEWVSYSLGILSAIVIGLFVRVFFYLYKKRDEKAIEERGDVKIWHMNTVEYAQCIQQMKKNWEKRKIPQFSETQRKLGFIAESLSSHHTKGELLDINDSTLSLLEETTEKCREVVRVNTDLGAVGIKSEITGANESAKELEQSAKGKL